MSNFNGYAFSFLQWLYFKTKEDLEVKVMCICRAEVKVMFICRAEVKEVKLELLILKVKFSYQVLKVKFWRSSFWRSELDIKLSLQIKKRKFIIMLFPVTTIVFETKTYTILGYHSYLTDKNFGWCY